MISAFILRIRDYVAQACRRRPVAEPLAQQERELSFTEIVRRAPRLRFPAGTKIICPKCGHHIATARRNIYSHEHISSLPWEGVDPRSTMHCPVCIIVGYSREMDGAMQLHTEEGWR